VTRGGVTRRRPTWSVALLVSVLVAAGCGIGDKQQDAEGIHASHLRLAESSPASGTVTYELELDERTLERLESAERAQLESALAGGSGNPKLSGRATLDANDRRARVLFGEPAPEGAEAVLAERTTLFLDNVVFVRRQNARSTERRTWARLDVARIIDNERPLDAADMTPDAILASVASTVNPTFLVELVRGTLAGSVERIGTEPAGGVETVRYDANISFDKAMSELDFDDEERAVRTRLFRLIGSRNDVLPAKIWIDREGRLRRLYLELDQQVTRQRKNHLLVTLELPELGAGAALDPPPQEATVTYERFGRLTRSAVPEGV
jgi:hypothetical protein